MAESRSPRFGVPRWTAGSDTLNRAELDDLSRLLDELGAIDAQGTAAARPAAGIRGRYYFATDGGVAGAGALYRDTGLAWRLLAEFDPTGLPLIRHELALNKPAGDGPNTYPVGLSAHNVSVSTTESADLLGYPQTGATSAVGFVVTSNLTSTRTAQDFHAKNNTRRWRRHAFHAASGDPVTWTAWEEVIGANGGTLLGGLAFRKALSAGNLLLDLDQGYGLYSDNTGPGSALSRLWLNGPDGGALYLGPRAGASLFDYMELRARRTLMATGTFFEAVENRVRNALVGSNESTTSTAFTNLATNGPVLIIPSGHAGRLEVTLSAQMRNTSSGASVLMGLQVENDAGGALIVGPTDNEAAIGTAQNHETVELSYALNGLPANINLRCTAKYRVTGGTGEFTRRRLTLRTGL